MSLKIDIVSSQIEKKTKFSLLWTSLLNEFFISFFGLMPFILRKELLASTFQLSLLTMIKPAVAVLSFYWSSRVIKTRISLRNNLVIAGVLARVPFLCFFLFDSVWYMVFASAMYMLFSRAAIPSWMEILKLNLKKNVRERFFSLSSILGYAEGVIIALMVCSFLDKYQSAWKVFFIISSLLGLTGVYLQYKTPIFIDDKDLKKPLINLDIFLKPWKEGIALIKKRPDFARFQIGTMASGFGLMLMTPALVIFFADNLKLALSEVTIGRIIFMGLGFVFLSPLWAKALQKRSINFLTGIVCIGFAIYPILMICALYNKAWIFIAFLFYGITQAGSHLIWHLSGTIFAKDDEDSSRYSSINVLMVGVRGIIAPLIGGLLCEVIGPINVFIIAMGICFFGSVCMLKKRPFFSTEPSVEN